MATLKKSFVSIEPEAGDGETEVSMTVDPNASLSERTETINFTAAGATKSLAVNQDGLSFQGQIWLSKDPNVTGDITFTPYPTAFEPTGGTNGCSKTSGTVKLVRTSERYYVQCFAAISKALLGDSELICLVQGLTSAGVVDWSSFNTFTDMNQDDNYWWGQTEKFSSLSGGYYTRLLVSIGLGRGDIGIENDQYLQQWYFISTNK